MAIISLIGSTVGSAINGGNVTLTLPGNYSSGNVAIVVVTLGTSTTATLACASSSGGAFTQIVTTVASSFARFGVFRTVISSTSALTQAVITGTASALDTTVAGIHIFRNVDQVTPEDVTATSTTGASTTPDSPSITVTSCGCAIISAVGTSLISTLTAPSSWLNATTKTTNDTNDATIGQAWITNATTNAFDPASWTSTTTTPWCSATIALRPVAYTWDEMGVISDSDVVKASRTTVVRSY